MAQVNYVREHERFIEYAADEGVTAGEQLLWYALMHIFNQRAEGRDWPDGFIRVNNDRLLTYFPAGWDAMARARNKLKQRGLIDFKGGNRNKEAPIYRMIYFYPCGYPQNTDNNTDNIGDNNTDNIGDNNTDNIGDINININRDNKPKDIFDDDVVVHDDVIPASAREQEDYDRQMKVWHQEVARGFRMTFGRIPTKTEVESIVNSAQILHFSLRMTIEAMTVAARNGAKNPAKYTASILLCWDNEEVRTPEQAGQYAYQWNEMYGYEAMDAAREDRRQQNQLSAMGG